MANTRRSRPKISGQNDQIVGTARGRRLALLLPRSDTQSDEDRRRRKLLLKYQYCFDDELSAQFQKIRKLPGIKPREDGSGGVPDDDLRFEVGDIVYKYLRRYNRDYFARLHNLYDNAGGVFNRADNYFLNLENCMRDAAAAAPLLQNVILGLGLLDGDHWNQLRIFTELGAPKTVGKSPQSFADLLIKTSTIVALIPDFMQLVIGDALPSGTQGQPKVRYLAPTAELLLLWLKLTGQPPVTTTKKTARNL